MEVENARPADRLIEGEAEALVIRSATREVWSIILGGGGVTGYGAGWVMEVAEQKC